MRACVSMFVSDQMAGYITEEEEMGEREAKPNTVPIISSIT